VNFLVLSSGAATEHGTSAHGDCIALIIHNHSCKSCTRQPHSGTVFLRLNPTTTLSQLSCMRLSPSRLIQVRCSECPLTLSHNLRNGIIQQLQLILLEHICSLEGWIAKYCNKEIKKNTNDDKTQCAGIPTRHTPRHHPSLLLSTTTQI